MIIQQDAAFPAMTAQQLNAFQLLRFVHRSIDVHLNQKMDQQTEISLSQQASTFIKQCQTVVQGYPMSLEVTMEALFEHSEAYLDEMVALIARADFTKDLVEAPHNRLLDKLKGHFEDYLDIEPVHQMALAYTLCYTAEKWVRYIGRSCVGYVCMNKEAIDWCAPPMRVH